MTFLYLRRLGLTAALLLLSAPLFCEASQQGATPDTPTVMAQHHMQDHTDGHSGSTTSPGPDLFGHDTGAHAGHDMGAHAHHGALPPVGVMGAHTHGRGGWMLSYRYMHMNMDGNRDGTGRVGTQEVLDDFMVAPLDMTMDMHMLGAMYGLTDTVTLMAMIPYLDKSMDHRTRMGVTFTTDAEGFGDAKLTALFTMFDNGAHHVHLGAGLSLPTGSIDEKDDTPAGPDQQLPYPMQLGSGTFDLMPGLTYLGNSGAWSWGGQVLATLRLGDNDRDYSLGDSFDLTAWLARQLGPLFSASLRAKASFWGDIDGADKDLNPMMVPTADPDRRGGSRVDILAGLSLQGPNGPLQGHSLSLELGFPVYQKLDGPQLETDWTFIGGWRWMF